MLQLPAVNAGASWSADSWAEQANSLYSDGAFIKHELEYLTEGFYSSGHEFEYVL